MKRTWPELKRRERGLAWEGLDGLVGEGGGNVLDELLQGFNHIFNGGLAADAVAVIWFVSMTWYIMQV
jgi:hypothetical protein